MQPTCKTYVDLFNMLVFCREYFKVTTGLSTGCAIYLYNYSISVLHCSVVTESFRVQLENVCFLNQVE